MMFDLIQFAFGLLVLFFGADWLIRGAASLALKFGIRPLVVGLTVVALGTSMPEFLINFLAAVAGEDGLALGNIVGSNIANIALILGLSALVFPMNVSPRILRKEYPILVAVMVGFYLMARDGMISKADGAMLVAGLSGFLVFLVVDARRSGKDKENDDHVASTDALLPMRKKLMFLAGGVVLLSVGAHLMVEGAVNIANALGVPSVVVGLTVVAIGTSLPELAASLMCAIRQESDLSVGNVIGSNLLNVLFVVGVVATIRPLAVDADSINTHFPVMLLFTIALLPIARTQFQIGRLEGALLIAGFLGYMIYLVAPYL